MQIPVDEQRYITQKYTELHRSFDDWKDLYMDVRDFVYPYLGEFEGEEKNKGYHHDEELLRTMIIKYANILASGMQWGITSPTRPWLRTSIADKRAMKRPEVKTWFSMVDDLIMRMLGNSNFYQENQKFYLEMAVFGTAAMFVQEDMEKGVRFHTFTIGEYFIGTDYRGEPNTFARILSLTKDQIKEQFGLTDNEWNLGGANNGYYTVYHLIAPNPNFNPSSIHKDYMPFKEWYWVNKNNILQTNGYHEFPVTIGRWSTKGSDVYGTGPGIWSLGDARQIQIMWRDITTAAELSVKPPMQAPSDVLANGGINLMPSAANYYNPLGNSDGGIRPLFQVQPDFTGAATIQQAIEDCIKEHFNVNVFQLLSEQDKSGMTAREVIELSSEKMSQMGPLVDRMQTEVLPKTIERVINICMRMGLFPPAPEDIQGVEMDIHYESVLSQAQQQNQITPIIDTFQQVIGVAMNTQKPEILDKLNFDAFTETIADLNGIPPELIVSDEEVAQIRQARAQQEQMMQAAQMAANSAQIAKTASEADLDGNNALTNVLGGVAGIGQ